MVIFTPFIPNQVIESELEATFFSFYSSASSTVCNNPIKVNMLFGRFQLIVEVDGVQDFPGKHVYHSLIIGEPGPYVRYPSHSFLPRLGPQVYMLLLDCRYVFRFSHCVLRPFIFWFIPFVVTSAERKKDQVCSHGEYQRVFERLNSLPSDVEHVIIQIGADTLFFYFSGSFTILYPFPWNLGIPIAYPRMVFLETALESKYNPLVALGRNGALGLSGFVNKFNADAELLDDLVRVFFPCLTHVDFYFLTKERSLDCSKP